MSAWKPASRFTRWSADWSLCYWWFWPLWLALCSSPVPRWYLPDLIILCLALPGFMQAAEGGSEEVLICSFLPSLICSFIVVFSVIIFNIAWTIYGAVLFFPAATGPYPTCSDGKDAKVLAITLCKRCYLVEWNLTTNFFFIFESRSENKSCLFMYTKTQKRYLLVLRYLISLAYLAYLIN